MVDHFGVISNIYGFYSKPHIYMYLIMTSDDVVFLCLFLC